MVLKGKMAYVQFKSSNIHYFKHKQLRALKDVNTCNRQKAEHPPKDLSDSS